MSFEEEGWEIVQSTDLKVRAHPQGWHRSNQQGGHGLGSPYFEDKNQWLKVLGEGLNHRESALCKSGSTNREAPTQLGLSRN